MIDVSHNIFVKFLVKTAFVFTMIYSVVFFLLDAKLTGLLLLITGLLFTGIFFLLERSGRQKTSYFFFIVSCTIYIAIPAMTISYDLTTEYYLIPAAILSLLVFKSNQRKEMFAGVLIPMAMWFLFLFKIQISFWRVVDVQNFPVDFFHKMNFAGSFLITLIFINYYNRYLEQIKLNEQFVYSVFNSVPAYVAYINPDYTHRFVNRIFESRFNSPAADLLRKKVEYFTGKEMYPEVKGNLERAFKGEAVQFDLRGLNSEGGKSFNSINYIPHFNESQKVIGVLAIANELSDSTILQEKLETKTRELDFERAKAMNNAKLASLGEMAAGIAHEINNPLGIISGTALLMDKFRNEPEKLDERIAAIQKASDRIIRIVNGLRKFSRTSEKDSKKLLLLNDIISESIVLSEIRSTRYAVPVIFEENCRSSVYCDEVEIGQVLINLISNSIDAVRDLNEKWIRIVLSEKDNSIVLTVKDSGAGISPKVADQMFNPFFTTKPAGNGTGLGLSIVRGILQDHQATIEYIKDSPHTSFEIKFSKLKEA